MNNLCGMLLKNLEKALCEWDSCFEFNSQILIRNKFVYLYFSYLQFIFCNFLILFLLGNSYSYLILLGSFCSTANLHPRVPFLASIEPPLELTLCTTRQPLQSRSLVHLYPKVSFMLLQQDLNPCYSELFTSKYSIN